MPVTIEGEEYYTNSEVSDELKVSRQTLWRWREKGSIPAGLGRALIADGKENSDELAQGLSASRPLRLRI